MLYLFFYLSIDLQMVVPHIFHQRSMLRSSGPLTTTTLRNQCATALAKVHRINNIWFWQVVGKDHPNLYSSLLKFQKEQGFTEICLLELKLGKKSHGRANEKLRDLQARLENIAADYKNLSVVLYSSNLAYNDRLQIFGIFHKF